MKRINRTLARLVLALSVLLGTAAAGVPSASAVVPAVCNVVGQGTNGAYDFDMLCQGSDEFAGLWKLNMADGLVSGVGPQGQTLQGTYVEIPNCTIHIGIHIYKCFYIYAQVCVNGSICVWVRIVICIRIDIDICIWISWAGTGDAIMQRDDTGLQTVSLPVGG